MWDMKIVLMYFFFNDTATTEIYTLSLHDALPICERRRAPAQQRDGGPHEHHGEPAHERRRVEARLGEPVRVDVEPHAVGDRKSTRLNSSHANISYAVFCLKKKK